MRSPIANTLHMSKTGATYFIKFRDREEKMEVECPSRCDCCFERYEIDLPQYRLKVKRCKTHGELYGESVNPQWRRLRIDDK